MAGHDWNAVRLEGKWRFFDSTWGAGYVGSDKLFHKSFTPYWFDTPPERRCDRLVVLMLDGWKQSRGVHAEIAIARRLGLPVTFMDMLQ